MINERDRITTLHCRVVTELVLALRTNGRYQEALDHVMTAISVSPDQEELHTFRVQLHLELGQTQYAVRHYLNYCKQLQAINETPGHSLSSLIEPFVSASFTCKTQPRRGYSRASKSASRQAVVSRSAGLPAPINRYFGRESELSQVTELLRLPNLADTDSNFRPDGRLVTVTGLGGTGKTRFATECAVSLQRVYNNRVIWINMNTVGNEQDVLAAITNQANAALNSDVLATDLRQLLNGQPYLIILDNCEHLISDIGRIVSILLSSIETLRVMITSRVPLRVPGEIIIAIRPLSTPRELQSVSRLYEFPSVQLFINRAQMVAPDFQLTQRNAVTIARLVNRLDGIPLALEMAASRLRTMSVSQIAEAIDHRFDVLVRTRAGSTRHQALIDAIAWSYSLLSTDLRAFFNKLLVFQGPFSLDTARIVCDEPRSLEYFEELVDYSLVTTETIRDTMRFGFLESVREYAILQSGEVQVGLRAQHASYFADITDQFAVEVRGSKRRESLMGLDSDYHDIAAAIQFLRSNAVTLRMASNIWRYWEARGTYQEGINTLDAAICGCLSTVSVEYAAALHGIGVLKERVDDLPGAEAVRSRRACRCLILSACQRKLSGR